MKIDNFIDSCFPNKDSLTLPKTKEIAELKKTWGEVIDNFSKDYGPKTKEAKYSIKKATKKEEELENERIKVQRQKMDAENKLKLAEEEDKKTLEKILKKYSGDNLSKELDRLNELPIESITLIEKDEKLVPTREESPTWHEDSDGNLSVTMSAVTTSANTLRYVGIDPGFAGYSDPTEEPRETREREPDEDTCEKLAEHKPLPWLVIFTSPLKTIEPSVEELKHFKFFKRAQIKSWANRDIGRFVILIDLENLGRNRLSVFNLDKQTDGIYDHACVNAGSVCFGNRASDYDTLAKKYQIFDMVDMIFDLLQSVATARPYSYPHCEWDKWFERSESVKVEDVQKKIKNFLKNSRRPCGDGPTAVLASEFAQEYQSMVYGGGAGGNGSGISVANGSGGWVSTTSSTPTPNGLNGNDRQMVENEVNGYLRNLEQELNSYRNRYEEERAQRTAMERAMSSASQPMEETNGL